MSDFREGCWAKIERAEEHIQNLKAEIDAFFLSDPKPYRIVREAEDEGRSYRWIGFEDRALPLRFAVITGEIIHHLRSSLDHLVVAMVLHKGKAVSTDHGFPITETPEKFKAAVDGGKIKSISLSAQRLIESKQPYNTRDGTASSILNALHRNDIEDKHRLLLVVAACAFMDSMSINADDRGHPVTHNLSIFPPTRLTKEGVKIAGIGGPKSPKFDPDAKFSPVIAFDEFGTIKLNPVLTALTKARDFVVQTIREFDGEFVAHAATIGSVKKGEEPTPIKGPLAKNTQFFALGIGRLLFIAISTTVPNLSLGFPSEFDHIIRRIHPFTGPAIAAIIMKFGDYLDGLKWAPVV